MHMQTKRNPRLTVHLNSQGKIFGMNVALTLSYWCRGKPNLFLIAKPNGLCMGSAMLVRTCCFYSPLPLHKHETRLANNCVWAWSHLKWEVLQVFLKGEVSICQSCHYKWIYLPICYHLLIKDLDDNCHKSCHKMFNKMHFLGVEGDVWRGMKRESKSLWSTDHKACAVELFCC